MFPTNSSLQNPLSDPISRCFFPVFAGKSQPGGFDSPKSILWLLHNLQFIISRLVDVAPHSPWFLCRNQGQRRKINPSVLFWCVKKWRLCFVVWCSRCSTTQTPKLMVLYNLDFWLPKKNTCWTQREQSRHTKKEKREGERHWVHTCIPTETLIHMYLDEWIFSYFTTLKYGVFEGSCGRFPIPNYLQAVFGTLRSARYHRWLVHREPMQWTLARLHHRPSNNHKAAGCTPNGWIRGIPLKT